MQSKVYMSPVAAQAIHDKLSQIDQKVAEQVNVINTAATAIAQATNEVAGMWADRQKLAEELDNNAAPDWTPENRYAIMGAAPASPRRFWKPAPIALSPAMIGRIKGRDTDNEF